MKKKKNKLKNKKNKFKKRKIQFKKKKASNKTILIKKSYKKKSKLKKLFKSLRIIMIRLIFINN